MIPVEFWYQMDLRLLAAYDVLLVQGKWQQSRGTLGEIQYAKEHHMPIYYFDEPEDRDALIVAGGESDW